MPQMANLDLIGAVNFKKGCYPGQEIVARMQYLGKNKRRMYLAHVDAETCTASREPSCSAWKWKASPAAWWSTCKPRPNGGYDLLAVVQIASHDAFPVHLGALNGTRLQFQAAALPDAVNLPAQLFSRRLVVAGQFLFAIFLYPRHTLRPVAHRAGQRHHGQRAGWPDCSAHSCSGK